MYAGPHSALGGLSLFLTRRVRYAGRRRRSTAYVRLRTDREDRHSHPRCLQAVKHRYQTVSLFRCARLDQLENIDVLSEISEVNRLLERRFPDCTIQRVDIGDYGQETQWVTVDLEITAQSNECKEWYWAEMARRRISILDCVRRNAFD